MFQTENELVERFCEYLLEGGYEVFREVAFYGRRIDVLAVYENTLYAYEAKLRRWSEALIQAQRHVISVDYSLVVMPSDIAKRLDQGSFRSLGIGLIGMSDDGWISLVDPLPSNCLWEPAKAQLQRTVECFREAGTPLCIL